jgi:hypothetical protein
VPRGTQGHIQSPATFAYEGFTPYAHVFQRVRLAAGFLNSVRTLQRPLMRLSTPILQRLQAITQDGFGLFPFRSPLLWESFSFPGGT